jgi:hypothetical protein
MVSIVVCSIRPDQLARLQQSVEATIGLPHEWLVADNRNTGKGICQVYNELAAISNHPYLLFLHEDVTFERRDWGKQIRSVFEQHERLGLLGVAGSTIKSSSISGWYTGNAAFDRYHLTHALPGHTEVLKQLPDHAAYHPVVCLDGVFLFVRRSVWEAMPFDAEQVKGFHFYDLDFSLRVANKFDVGVVSDLGLIHHTEAGGDYGTRWAREAILFHQRWKERLPMNIPGAQFSEGKIQRVWLDRLKNQSIRLADRINWVRVQRQFLHPGLYYSILKFFLYHPLRLRRVHQYLRSLRKQS